MKIYDEIEQGTQEWLDLRLGKFTASKAQPVGANGKGLETLVFEKVAELMTGKPKDSFTNSDIERGNELEELARNAYELETGHLVNEVAFVELNERVGCSPDGLIGEDGLVEIKCVNDANYVKFMYEKKIDPQYVWQMQFQLLVTNRKWVDFTVFNPNFKRSIVIEKIARDEKAIAKLQKGLDDGVAMLNRILKEIS
jgi:putative phage-type endonuclease